jgi:hypothetical protein
MSEFFWQIFAKAKTGLSALVKILQLQNFYAASIPFA